MSRPISQGRTGAPVDGVLVVDKPKGITSHDVVVRVRRILNTRRVGHVGTLDPMATGVLPLVLGRATRLASFLSVGDKVYHAVIRLGVTTDTYDATGTVLEAGPRGAGRVIDKATIDAAAREFTGTFLQTPPPFSAKKIGGVRSYRLARRKAPVTPSAVEVTVRSVAIETFESDCVTCRVTCAPGFYMRSLAHDLGNSLGIGGCLEQLRRERSGSFSLTDAATLERLTDEPAAAMAHIVPVDRLLPELPSVVVTDRGARLATHGNPLMRPEFSDPGDHPDVDRHEPCPVRVLDQDGALLAIAERPSPNVLHPRIVLV